MIFLYPVITKLFWISMKKALSNNASHVLVIWNCKYFLTFRYGFVQVGFVCTGIIFGCYDPLT